MRNFLLIGMLVSLIYSCADGSLANALDKVEIGMSPDEALAITGEPSDKIELTEPGSANSILIWHFKNESGAILHSIEFTDNRVVNVVKDFAKQQEEIQKLMQDQNK